MNKFYSSTETAALLGIGEETVRKYAKELGVGRHGRKFVFTDSSITGIRNLMAAKKRQAAEVAVEPITQAAAIPFNAPLAPSRHSAAYRPRETYRSGKTPRTAGDVAPALAGIEEARERAAAANGREAARVGGAR